MSEAMHTPSAADMAEAIALAADLEAHSDRVLADRGPYKEYECCVLAAAEIEGWLYAARRLDSVRRALKKAIASAAWRFTGEFHQPLPACLDGSPVVTIPGEGAQ
ncbi:MAG: hypothetical protein JWR07_1943 [Nevskia sp.]|nr:hypothetical protein [Nevskia sp.]